MFRAALYPLLIWLLGWLTLVPYCLYLLFFEATRDQYALLIMLPVGWVFFYWPIVTPILGALKIRRYMKLLDNREQLMAQLRADYADGGEEPVIDFLARENKIPRFIARRLFHHLKQRLLTEAHQ